MAVDIVIDDLPDCSELEAYVAQRLETVVSRFACRVSGARRSTCARETATTATSTGFVISMFA